MSFTSSCRDALVVAGCVVLAVVGAAPLDAQTPPSLFVEPARAVDARVASRPDAVRARRLALRIDLLAAALAPGTSARAPFLLNLFDDVTLTIDRERLEADGRGHASWVGAVAGDSTSMASFTWSGRLLVGSVVTRGVAYELATDDDGAVVVRQRAPMTGIVELPPRVPAARDMVPADRLAVSAAATSTIDVLVVYTAAARTRAGGTAQIQAGLANAVAVTNTAFQRSAVGAEIRAVGVLEVPYVESPSTQQGLADDLTVISPGGAGSSAVEGARNATGADLVALITGRDPPQACGIAWIGPSPGAAYSVTEQACLFAGQWSFSHELGHNFGADHAPGDSQQLGVFYARGYRAGAIRTLMAYAVTGSPPRILNYSSASVLEPPALPTGNSLQDNARRLNETAATLAAYKAAAGTAPPTPTGFAASVNGPAVTLSWSPATIGGAISSFVLEVGPAPGSAAYGSVALTQSPAVFPNVPAGTYYMRLRSSGPGGVSPPTPDAVATVTNACVPPGLPSLTATLNGGAVTLAWSATPGSSPVTYYLGVGTTPGTDNLGVFPMGASTSFAGSPPSGTYYVRVVAANACGYGPVSATVAVTIP